METNIQIWNAIAPKKVTWGKVKAVQHTAIKSGDVITFPDELYTFVYDFHSPRTQMNISIFINGQPVLFPLLHLIRMTYYKTLRRNELECPIDKYRKEWFDYFEFISDNFHMFQGRSFIATLHYRPFKDCFIESFVELTLIR